MLSERAELKHTDAFGRTNCRAEEPGDVISGQRVQGVEFFPLAKFGDPSSNRLAGMLRCDRRRQTTQLVNCETLALVFPS